MRRHRNPSDKKLFTADEIRRLLKAADATTEAVILLGINCGLGNTDIAELDQSRLDLKVGWLDYPSGKSGIQRRIPLWKETVKALRAAIKQRPKPKHKDDADAVFLTARRERWVRIHETSRTDAVTGQFGKLLRKLKINGRKGLGFYSLRHTFATIGLQTADRDAVKALMGNTNKDILENY